MNPINSVRLTYLRPPFKYQSSWLVFLHVIKWNHLKSFSEIRDIIGLPRGQVSVRDRWWDGEHVPHWRVERACGLPLSELKYSYIDGWFPLPTDWRRQTLEMRPCPKIRHCPECIKYGYHSVVFYFECVSHCPWHHLPLEYCRNCSDALQRKGHRKHGIAAISEACRHMRLILGIEAPEEAPKDYIVQAEVWCDGLNDWIKNAQKLIGEGVYEVVVGLPSERQNADIVFKYLAWHASRTGPTTNYLPITILRIPRSKLAEESYYHEILKYYMARFTIANETEATRPRADLDDVIAMAKSIRRYIFKRYLRLHRKCLARIARLNEESWYALNLEFVCPCVMAYLITLSRQWGVSPWDLLHMQSSHVGTFLNRIYLSRKTLACEVEVAMYKSIGDFYRIWSVLRHYTKLNCRMLVLNYRHDGDHTSYVAPMIFETARVYRDYIHRDALIFMENPEVALAASVANCSCRRRNPLLVNVDPFDNYLLKSNQNIFCVFFNVSSNGDLRLDL